jgi:hypothetical protein
MNLIILFSAVLALTWLSTRSGVPGDSPVPVHAGRPKQRRR